MDRYDPYTDKFLRDTQYDIPSTNLAEVGTNCSEFPNNSDTISRQAAIDALDKRFDSIPMEQTSEILLLRKDLREMPPIQPKSGRWVLVCDNNGMHFICNKCGAWRYHQEQKFCGECGADMREVNHESN